MAHVMRGLNILEVAVTAGVYIDGTLNVEMFLDDVELILMLLMILALSSKPIRSLRRCNRDKWAIEQLANAFLFSDAYPVADLINPLNSPLIFDWTHAKSVCYRMTTEVFVA